MTEVMDLSTGTQASSPPPSEIPSISSDKTDKDEPTSSKLSEGKDVTDGEILSSKLSVPTICSNGPLMTPPLFRAWDEEPSRHSPKKRTSDDQDDSCAKKRRLESALDRLRVQAKSPQKSGKQLPESQDCADALGQEISHKSLNALGNLISNFLTNTNTNTDSIDVQEFIHDIRSEIKYLVEGFLSQVLNEVMGRVQNQNRPTKNADDQSLPSPNSPQVNASPGTQSLNDSTEKPDTHNQSSDDDYKQSDADYSGNLLDFKTPGNETDEDTDDQNTPLPFLSSSKRKRTKVTDSRLPTRDPQCFAKLFSDTVIATKPDPCASRPLFRPPSMFFPPTGAPFNLPYPPAAPGAAALLRPSPYPALSSYWGHLNYLSAVGLQYGATGCLSRMQTPVEPLHQAATVKEESREPSPATSDKPSTPPATQLTNSTALSPLHLRKAKLMFFYVRYPSSGMLRAYYSDVRFDKHTTAQIVKWFSNFREFFYGVIERHARELVQEGGVKVEELLVPEDSELLRSLCSHYNRNSRIKVPDRFRVVAQATVREFYQAIAMGKDKDPAWKKHIYKIIARYDDPLPDFFKSLEWMQKLADS